MGPLVKFLIILDAHTSLNSSFRFIQSLTVTSSSRLHVCLMFHCVQKEKIDKPMHKVQNKANQSAVNNFNNEISLSGKQILLSLLFHFSIACLSCNCDPIHQVVFHSPLPLSCGILTLLFLTGLPPATSTTSWLPSEYASDKAL